MEEELNKLLLDLEKQNRDAILRTYNNQPKKVGISSLNANLGNELYTPYQDCGFNNFSVNLQRPALGVKGLQLLKVNIPQCNACFGDYELVFYYYRLRTQINIDGSTSYSELPNIHNLYCCRLLPSYYKPELINNSTQYGFNRVFDSYTDLASELSKITAYDLAYENDPTHKFPFIPNDISLTFNSKLNKFQMTGNNVYTDFSAPAWDSLASYPINFIVNYVGNYYISTQQVPIGTPPENGDYWTAYTIGETTVCNTYLIPSYDDPNVKLLGSKEYALNWNPYHIYVQDDLVRYQGKTWVAQTTSQNSPPPGLYNSTKQYHTGDLMYFNGMTYKALSANINDPPPDSPLWVTEGVAQNWVLHYNQSIPTKLGINGLSKRWDFEILQSIPGQPSDKCNRNLALRLGFTWNDSQSLTTQIVTPETYPEGTLLPLIYNRLRPVPLYASTETLTSYPAYSTGTITADAYANLVYSSVIYIYTNVIGSSTLDSVRTNNLLAIVPMNCPSLGITFSADSVDQVLDKVCADVYTLYFELRDEHDQPYVLSNNGVVTMEIKLLY